MEYLEYIDDLKRIHNNLVNEQYYYKCMCTYFLVMISLFEGDQEDLSIKVSDYLKDLIDDSETELEIINLIVADSKEIIESLTIDYFEGSPKFKLYQQMYKRINNSTKKRAMDAYPVILMFHNLIGSHITLSSKYNTVKRKKYMKQSEYQGYINILKNKD